MTPLEKVLAGRDERAFLQKRFLAERGPRFLIQASLNIPGFPKRLPYDKELVEFASERLKQTLRTTLLDEGCFLCGAGAYSILVFRGGEEEAREAKGAAVKLEKGAPWGRLLDLDVLTQGGAVTRESLGLAKRKCLLCDNDAKICSALQTHDVSGLRAAAGRLLMQFHRETRPQCS